MSEMLTSPKKIVDGLTEVFRGLTRMCEGMAEQIELLEFTSEDAEDEDVVQLTSQSYGINADEQEGILKYLIAGGDLSLYGLSNAVTRASQDVASYDRATALEGIGWQVATMEPAQWKEINR